MFRAQSLRSGLLSDTWVTIIKASEGISTLARRWPPNKIRRLGYDSDESWGEVWAGTSR